MLFPKKPECTLRNNPHSPLIYQKVTKMVTLKNVNTKQVLTKP